MSEHGAISIEESAHACVQIRSIFFYPRWDVDLLGDFISLHKAAVLHEEFNDSNARKDQAECFGILPNGKPHMDTEEFFHTCRYERSVLLLLVLMKCHGCLISGEATITEHYPAELG